MTTHHLYRLHIDARTLPSGQCERLTTQDQTSRSRIEEAAAKALGRVSDRIDPVRGVLIFSQTTELEIYLSSLAAHASTELREFFLRLLPELPCPELPLHVSIERDHQAALYLRNALLRRQPAIACSLGPHHAVLAAHGAGQGSEANSAIEEMALSLDRHSGWQVSAAFHLGEPGFESISSLSEQANEGAWVLPMLTSRGWFWKRLTSILGAGEPGAPRMLAPIGIAPRLREAIAQALLERLETAEICQEKLRVLVVGHGTRKTSTSAASTEILTRELQCLLPASEVRSAFLDQEPRLQEVMAATHDERSHLAIIPFLLGGGSHAKRDIADALGCHRSNALVLPPVLELPSLPLLLQELLQEADRKHAVASISNLAGNLLAGMELAA